MAGQKWRCFVAGSLLIISGCGPRTTAEFARSTDLIYRDQQPSASRGGLSPCSDPLNYLPDTAFPQKMPMKYVKLRFHFMNDPEGKSSFTESAGVDFANAVLDGCNRRLEKNVKMHLPPGNNTPVLPFNYRLVLYPLPGDPDDDGIYFHRDPDLYYYIHGKNSNRTSRDVIDKYATSTDSVINVFFMPHHPDSVGRPGYRAVGTGIALGTSIKVAQIFNDKLPPESCHGLINHEIGHVMGLRHTWRGSDGCDDTPTHQNCFSYTSNPPCDTAVSNNMMDYNQWQHALTPCQIGKVHRAIAREGSRIRKCIVPEWCEYDPEKSLFVRSDAIWNAETDLYGDLHIDEGVRLEINCRIALPAGASIYVGPGATLVLHNARLHNSCGDRWEGVRILSKRDIRGTVEISGNSEILDAVHPLPGSQQEEQRRQG